MPRIQLTEAQLADLAGRMSLPPKSGKAGKGKPSRTSVTELQFTAQVIQFARLHRWRTMHVRPGRTSTGWRTPVQGDGVGWPDLVAIRGTCVLVAELKIGKRKPTEAQREWLAAWATAGAEVHVWTPDDWGSIEAAVGGDRPQKQVG